MESRSLGKAVGSAMVEILLPSGQPGLCLCWGSTQVSGFSAPKIRGDEETGFGLTDFPS